ncbi:MAG: hypothetical protein WCD07_08980 [Burkholderiales bacterium]
MSIAKRIRIGFGAINGVPCVSMTHAGIANDDAGTQTAHGGAGSGVFAELRGGECLAFLLGVGKGFGREVKIPD